MRTRGGRGDGQTRGGRDGQTRGKSQRGTSFLVEVLV